MFANTGAAAVPPKRSRDAGSGSSIETNTVKRGFSAGKNPTNDAKYAREPSSLMYVPLSWRLYPVPVLPATVIPGTFASDAVPKHTTSLINDRIVAATSGLITVCVAEGVLG
jgi:hypothetical protein